MAYSRHRVPFYVVLPFAFTVMSCNDGSILGQDTDKRMRPHTNPAGITTLDQELTSGPASCVDVKNRNPAATDGNYVLFHNGDAQQSWTAYCYNMDTTPTEYLTLPAGGAQNFSMLAHFTKDSIDLVTRWDRVRIDPATLVIKVDDYTFSSSTTGGSFPWNMTHVAYGNAGACAMGPGSASVDLTGTPFRIVETFVAKAGWGTIVPDASGQRVSISNVNGWCGGVAPLTEDAAGWNIHLSLDVPSAYQDNDHDGIYRLTCAKALLTCPQGQACDDFSGTAQCTARPASCADVKNRNPGATDGNYVLFHDGDAQQSWTAYCYNMATTPTEYLTLPAGGAQNFSMLAHFTKDSIDLVTRWDRVRIDPATLVIKVDDYTFSSSTTGGSFPWNMTHVAYGNAGACAMGPGSASVDLTGTPFRIAETFVAKAGWGTIVPDASGQRVSISNVNGWCGGVAPLTEDAAGWNIHLSLDVPSAYQDNDHDGIYRPTCAKALLTCPQGQACDDFSGTAQCTARPASCADVKNLNPGATDGNYVLFHDGESWTAYCYNMATTPTEYLTLPAGGAQNFSMLAHFTNDSIDLVTRWERVRIDPATLVIKVDDYTFSSSTTGGSFPWNMTHVAYGNAGACAMGPGSASVDLTGTSFRIAETFVAKAGWGTIVPDAGGQRVSISNVNGWCGGVAPQTEDPSGWNIHLTLDAPSAYQDK